MSKRKQIEQPLSDDLDLPIQIILKYDDAITLPYEDGVERYFAEYGLDGWEVLAERFPGLSIQRLYTSVSPERIQEMTAMAQKRNSDYQPPNFLTYFMIEVPPHVNASELLEALREWKPVELVYVSSPPAPGPAQPAGTNPEYGGANGLKQKYLLDGPTGISALFAWDQPGGTGAGVQFIDIEKGWVLNHADLLDQNGVPRVNLLSGVNLLEQAHGTNVLGILVAQDNQVGCVGIARDAIGSVVSAFRPSSGDNGVVWNIADAIKDAANRLKPGDVILLEVQVWRDGILAPAELEKAIFHEIELATNLGITVIEAAANGNQNLANFVNDEQPGLRILDPAHADYADSGAIMVAAATHPNNNLARHSGHSDTNYGDRVDCYAWGRQVKTTHFDPIDHPGDLDQYTATFGQTSAAAAIIAGVAILVQSMKMARDGIPYLPGEIRDILRDPQNGTAPATPNKTIRVMPDLRKIVQNGH